MGPGDEKYLLSTTFERDGKPVATPVWAAPLDSGELDSGDRGVIIDTGE